MPTENALSGSVLTPGPRRHSNGPQRLASIFRPARQLRRIFRELTFEAVEAISKPAIGMEDVHDARRCIKRARATLRLMRSVIGEVNFTREDNTLKAAADSLDALRDSEVALQTIDDLIERCKSGRTRARLQSCRLQLQQAHRESQASQGTSVSQAVALLETAATQSRDWTISDAWYSITEAVEQAYRRARRAYRQAGDSPDQSTLHALRKRTQYLRNALEAVVIQPSRSMERLVRRLSRLADLLGEDHDLAMLQTTLKTHRRGRLPAELRTVQSMIEHRRARLQARAFRRAARLYRSKPSRFATEFENHWRHWEGHLRN